MERMLELRPVATDDQASTRTLVTVNPFWHPLEARGIYGGVLISQSLVAAQETVSPSLCVQSMQCHFLKAGSSDNPIKYLVHTSDGCGAEVSTRVKAIQNDTLVFIASIRFSTRSAKDEASILASTRAVLPPLPPESIEGDEDDSTKPFVNIETIYQYDSSTPPAMKKVVWLRARLPFHKRDTVQTHLAALAFLSDSYFITTMAQVMGLRMGHRFTGTHERTRVSKGDTPPPTVSMMVSLDHVIHFHCHDFRADEWIYMEMEPLWAGEGRALVRGRMFSHSGALLATCMQEGVIRLKPQSTSGKM
ncbi:hypothetical protein BST61_g9504 [Cercospora zeina]